MTNFLAQAERDWMSARLSGTSGYPGKQSSQIRREYYMGHVSAATSLGPSTGLEELEKIWLRDYVVSAVGASAASTMGVFSPDIGNSELWKNAVVVIGGTPVRYLNQNKLFFYLNAS
jgi:hypothetical protein